LPSVETSISNTGQLRCELLLDDFEELRVFVLSFLLLVLQISLLLRSGGESVVFLLLALLLLLGLLLFLPGGFFDLCVFESFLKSLLGVSGGGEAVVVPQSTICDFCPLVFSRRD
jgi:NAD/NADP transhydrogenase beta subunit